MLIRRCASYYGYVRLLTYTRERVNVLNMCVDKKECKEKENNNKNYIKKMVNKLSAEQNCIFF